MPVFFGVFWFFFKIFGEHKSFCGATDTPVLDIWCHFLWLSKPEWAALFTLGGDIHDIQLVASQLFHFKFHAL